MPFLGERFDPCWETFPNIELSFLSFYIMLSTEEYTYRYDITLFFYLCLKYKKIVYNCY